MLSRSSAGGLKHLLFLSTLICLSGISPLTAQQPGASGSPQAAAPATGAAFHEEVVAEIPPGNELKGWLSAANHVVWIEKNEKAWTVKLDGKPQGQTYDEVKYASFNEDGTHLAFFGKRNGKWILVLDGQEGSSAYQSVTSVAFQPHGSSFAFCPCTEKKTCHLVVDGKDVGPQYEDSSYPRYSSDGKRLAYFGKRGKKWFAVVDGKETGPELDAIAFSDWGFSGRTNRFYAAVWPSHSKWTYLVDDEPGPAFEVISPIAFSEDEKHYAYGGADAHAGFGKKKTVGTVVLDGQSAATYEGSGMSGLWTVAFGASQEIAFGVRDLNANFHGVSDPAFNPGGKLVYAARRGKDDISVMVGDQAGPGFDEILSPVAFFGESMPSVYIARRGNDFVEVHDNQPGRSFSIDAKIGAVEWIYCSPDGAHLAYEIVRGGNMFKSGARSYSYVTSGYGGQGPAPPWLRARRSVVVDGQPSKEYNALGIFAVLFSVKDSSVQVKEPDWKHSILLVAGAEGNRDLVSIDGNESRLYNDAGFLAFADDGKSVRFIARDSARLLRVSHALQ